MLSPSAFLSVIGLGSYSVVKIEKTDGSWNVEKWYFWRNEIFLLSWTCSEFRD
jgi:hypothetical protein